ncbi:MAG: hypothetical protein J6Q42_03725, partial [Clostridia bacterium]|nr:hypothetical protein [Clostridia bacterium]
IGITEDATHCYADPNLLSPDVRKMLTQCSYEVSFPIKHPPYVVEDVDFVEADNKAYQKKNKYLKKIQLLISALKQNRWDIIFEKI